MSNIQSNAQEVIERLLSAYGVTTQRALAEALNVPSNNVSAWSQRNSVPGNAIIKCALDTGTDLHWLVKGELAEASFYDMEMPPQGKVLLDEICSSGGKKLLQRIMDAYGFTMQKQLCDLFHISSGTVSTWIRREFFPGDIVVACALDTKVSLRWLALGIGEKFDISEINNYSNLIPHGYLNSGAIEKVGFWKTDLTFLKVKLMEPFLLTKSSFNWIIDKGRKKISNGKWLLSIDSSLDIYDVILIPEGKIKINNRGGFYVCDVKKVDVVGKVIVSMDMDI